MISAVPFPTAVTFAVFICSGNFFVYRISRSVSCNLHFPLDLYFQLCGFTNLCQGFFLCFYGELLDFHRDFHCYGNCRCITAAYRCCGNGGSSVSNCCYLAVFIYSCYFLIAGLARLHAYCLHRRCHFCGKLGSFTFLC